MVQSLTFASRPGDRFLDFSSCFAQGGTEETPVAGISLVPAGSLNPFRQEGRRMRRDFFRQMNFPVSRTVHCRQLHTRKVVKAGISLVRGLRADGIITRRRGVLLTVTAADCMPVFLFDPENQALGLCHSGWKGTGIAARALEKMTAAFGTRPQQVTALLGPSIGGCCYRVDAQRAEAFAGEWGETAAVRREEGWFLDLKEANTRLLENRGVGRILTAGSCTVCDSRFGSFRREGPENYTRMAAFFGFSR